MKKLLHLGLVLAGVIAVCSGCSGTNVAVGAKNGALSTYQSNVGSLNTPGFALGDVVAMDPQTHKAWKVASVEVAPTDTAISQTVEQTSEPFVSSFDLSYSQNVTPVLRNEVDQTVRGQTVLHVESYFTRSFKNPAAFAMGSEPLAKAVFKAHAQNSHTKFFLVSAVSPAEKVYLTFAGGDANTAKFGKCEFHIGYDQNADLAKLAQDIPAFFKLTPLTVEEQKGHSTVAVDKNFGEKLPEYEFSGAVASSW